MFLSKITNSRNKFSSLCITVALFLGALFIDFKLSGWTIYPVYLVSILYASTSFTFCASIPLAAIAAFLSIRNEGANTANFINILLVRFALLFIISYLFSAYIDLIKTYRIRFELLKTLIPQCADCGSIFCKDGRWRNLKEVTGRPDLLGELPKHECEIIRKSNFLDFK